MLFVLLSEYKIFSDAGFPDLVMASEKSCPGDVAGVALVLFSFCLNLPPPLWICQTFFQLGNCDPEGQPNMPPLFLQVGTLQK